GPHQACAEARFYERDVGRVEPRPGEGHEQAERHEQHRRFGAPGGVHQAQAHQRHRAGDEDIEPVFGATHDAFHGSSPARWAASATSCDETPLEISTSTQVKNSSMAWNAFSSLTSRLITMNPRPRLSALANGWMRV